MLESEIVAIVQELESLGIKFTVIQRMDGTLRLNCWRFQDAWENRERINRLLAEQIENSPENAAQIADFVNKRSSATTQDEQSPSPS